MKNPVAKYNRKVNKSAVHADRKKANKRGYRKHKNKLYPRGFHPLVPILC